MWKYIVGWFIVNTVFAIYEEIIYGKTFLHFLDIFNVFFWGGLYLLELFGELHG